MPGVRGLQSYIAKNAAARNRVDLASTNESWCSSTKRRSKVRILCDFSPVVEWVLSAYDAYLVKTGQLSPYTLLYGGDLKLYGQRILAFIRALKRIGVSPIFFLEGSPGANMEYFEMQFPQLCTQHDQLLERCAAVHQVCEGTGNILQVQWQLAQDAYSEIVSCLQSGGVSLVHCTRGTTAEIIEYQSNHSSVVGVLSTNTDFAVAADSTLFPLSCFDLGDDLGIHSAGICPNPTKIVCEYVRSATLCQSLQLRDEDDLIDVSILCGNQFTARLNQTLELCKKLGLPSSSFECVAGWFRELDHELWPCIVQELHFDPVYRAAIEQSFKLYGPHDVDSPPAGVKQGDNTNGNCSLLKVEMKVSDTTLISVGNGTYWRWPVLEPVSLGQLCFSDLTLPLRRKAYSVLGQGTVSEYGRTSAKSFTTVPVEDDGSDVCVTGWSENQRLVALFQLVTEYSADVASSMLKDATANIASELDAELTPLLPNAVLVCASLCFMCHLSSQPKYQAPLEHHELQALLMTCLFCSASIPSHLIPERPSSRALTVAMQFSHNVQQVQLLAATLGVKDALPSPSAVFYPMAYIPHYMASVLTLQPQGQHHSSNLKEAYHNYHWALHKSPASRLFEVISKDWLQPNLKCLLKLFAESTEYIHAHSSFLFLSSKLPSPPPPHLQPNFDQVHADKEEHWEDSSDVNTECEVHPGMVEVPDSNEELKQKLLVSPRSDQDWSEMPISQDHLALEDFQFLSHDFEDGTEVEGGGELVGEEVELQVGSVQGEGGEEVEWEGVGRESADVEPEDSTVGVGSNGGGETDYESDSESVVEPQNSFSNKQDGIASSEGEEDLDITVRPPSSSSSSSSISTSCSSTQLMPTPPPTRQLHSLGRLGPDLPIAAHRYKLLELIEENRIVCVEGETGCGKSTRVPQYILDHSLSLVPPRECRVLVTQPRRMAAIKLAERVATERGERVGYTVGYCVGGEHTNTSVSAITYCTTGYLLQALVHNPDMVSKYTHIILDEIHERSTDADFTLLVVRELLASRDPDVKLIIMSATMQGSLVINYLRGCFTSVAGPYFVGVKHYGVDTYFIDELSKIPCNQSFWSECQLKSAMTLQHLAVDRPVEPLKLARPYVTTYAQEVCTEVVVSQAHMGESILIFLPGYHEIAHYFEYLQREVNGRGIANRIRMFVLHSQVPLEDQKDAFVDPPANMAHVILATNIAESSITLPKLRIVINFGIYRRLQYDSKRHISCLVKSWCSRASCEQRAGRAGRVFVGTVVHLFTRQFHDVVLPAYDPPEILTAPIAKLVLQAKQIGRMIGHPLPSDFLSRAIEPPSLQQLEAALQDLARLGAIESRPGEEIDEEADITFLGRFSLSLPVDLDLSRVVLYGVLFGCAADAIVMAAAMSLSQDVFSLPSRVLTKDETVFQQSLARSYNSRCSLDSHTYSDAIMVRNLFKEWLAFRSENAGKQSASKFTLARRFSILYACRWERLLQLEAVVCEIAQKTLHHIPTCTAVHYAVQKLTSLYNIRSFCKHTALSNEKSSGHEVSESDSFNIEFSEDDDILRSMLAASYPHQLLFGVRQCESLNEQEKFASLRMLQLMESSKLDISRTLTMTGGQRLSKASIQHLVEFVLPKHFCQITTFGSTALITLNHTFESNPLTSLLRNLKLITPVTTPLSTEAVYPPSQDDEKLISSSLPPELILFWQFGERRPQWKVGDISVSFPRPQHPLATSWFRLTKEKEKVQILSWRNPTGFMCEVDPFRKPLPFLAVASHLQGFSSRSYVSASSITLLPSLHSSRNALLIALTFQPLTARVSALVDCVDHRIVGFDINSFTLSSLPNKHYLDAVDINNINKLRQVISEVFTSRFTSNQLSANFLSEVPLLLSKLLSHRKAPHLNRISQQHGTEVSKPKEKGSVKWEKLLSAEEVIVCEFDESDSEGASDESAGSTGEQETVSRYLYLPPFQCSLLQHLPEVEESNSGVSVPLSVSVNGDTLVASGGQTHSDAESDSKTNFKLSANAPEFVPTGLQEDEAPTATPHPHTDDHPTCTNTGHHSTEVVERECIPAVPVGPVDMPLSLPTPPFAEVPLSSVLGPQFLSHLSHLPLEQQQQIKESIAGVYRSAVLPRRLIDQSCTFDKSHTARVDQSGQFSKMYSHRRGGGLLSVAQEQMKGRSVLKMTRGRNVRALSGTAASTPPVHHSTGVRESMESNLLVQSPVIPATSHLSPSFPSLVTIQHPKQPLPVATVSGNFDQVARHFFNPPQVPLTAQRSATTPLSLDHPELHGGVQGKPQFPHPYMTHLIQPHVATHSYPCSARGTKCGVPTSLMQSATLASTGQPMYPALQDFGSGMIARCLSNKPPFPKKGMTLSTSFSKSARKPLSYPFPSKLDLHSRAPGAPIASKPLPYTGGGYQARFPAQTSLTPFLKLPGVGDSTSAFAIHFETLSRPISLSPPGFPSPPSSGAPSRGHLSSDPSTPPHKTSHSYEATVAPPSLPFPVRQSQTIWSDLVDFIEVYLRDHGFWAELKTVFDNYLRMKRLPAHTPCPYNFLDMCKGRFTVRQAENHRIIIELRTIATQGSCSKKEGGEAEGAPERRLSETTAEVIVKPHCKEERKERREVEEMTDVGEKKECEEHTAIVSTEVRDVEDDTIEEYRDGLNTEKKDLSLPVYASNRRIQNQPTSSRTEDAEVTPTVTATEKTVRDITEQFPEGGTDGIVGGADHEELISVELMEEGALYKEYKEDVRECDVQEKDEVKSEERCDQTEMSNVEINSAAIEGGHSEVEDQKQCRDIVSEESGGKAAESPVEIHVGLGSGTHADAVELSCASQTENSNTLLIREGEQPPLYPITCDISDECGQGLGELLKSAGHNLFSGTNSNSSSRAVSPHKPAQDAAGEDASDTNGQQSASSLLGEYPGHDTAFSLAVENITQSTSTVQLCEFEDTDWVEAVDTASCDSHMTDNSVHMQPGSTDHKVEFFIACLKLVGGHSHINKLSIAYRKEYHVATYTSLRLFESHPEIFQVKRFSPQRSCIRLIHRIDQSKRSPSVSLNPAAEELMKEWMDVCPISRLNLGGPKRWPEQEHYSNSVSVRERTHSSVNQERGNDRREWRSWSRRESCESTGKPSKKRNIKGRERSRTPSGRVGARESWRKSRFSQKVRSPRFPRDVESESDPGHLCHILKYYKDFFATRTEPILYSDILSDYVLASSLPSEFYLPSDLLKHHFDVYREQGKRFIRPLDSAKVVETTSPPPSETQIKEYSPHKNEKEVTSVSPPETRKNPIPMKDQPCSPHDEVKVVNKGRKSATTKSSSGSTAKNIVPSSPEDIKSPTEPGHISHILEYCRNFFGSSHNSVLFSYLLKKYVRDYNLPATFFVQPLLLGKEFDIYFKHRLRFIRPHKKIEPASISTNTAATPTQNQREEKGSLVIEGDVSSSVLAKPSEVEVIGKDVERKKRPAMDKAASLNRSSNQRDRKSIRASKGAAPTRPLLRGPRDVTSPSEPGHTSHILKFYRDLFANRQEPLALPGFSLRYITAYDLPRYFFIPSYVLEDHYSFFRNADGLGYVCPRSWNWDPCTRNAAPVAPVIHDTPTVAEVWEEEEEEFGSSCVSETAVPSEGGVVGGGGRPEEGGEEGNTEGGKRERERRNEDEEEELREESEPQKKSGLDLEHESTQIGDEKKVVQEDKDAASVMAPEEGESGKRGGNQIMKENVQQQEDGVPKDKAEVHFTNEIPLQVGNQVQLQEDLESEVLSTESLVSEALPAAQVLEAGTQESWNTDSEPPLQGDMESALLPQGDLESEIQGDLESEPLQGDLKCELLPQGNLESELLPQVAD